MARIIAAALVLVMVGPPAAALAQAADTALAQPPALQEPPSGAQPADGTPDVAFAGIVTDAALEEAAGGLEAYLADRLQDSGRVRVLRRAELEKLLARHAERLVAGCPDEACGEVMSAVRALGAPYLLLADLHRVGETLVLSTSLLDSGSARAVARATLSGQAEQALFDDLPTLARRLLQDAGLAEPDPVPQGPIAPKARVALKLGNGLTTFASELISQNVLHLRANLEGDWFLTRNVVLFVELGTTLTNVQDPDSPQILGLRVVPLSFGAKHVWARGRFDLFAGAALGAGLVGLFRDESTDLRTAFATTVLGGFEWRFASSWAVGVEASTSLTDAILGVGVGQMGVPLQLGITATVGYIIH